VSTSKSAFDRAFNAVDDLGMDPTGSEPIDDTLGDMVANDTLLNFPPGEYLVTERHEATELDQFGLRGMGDSRTDVRLVFPEGYSKEFLLFQEDCRNVVWENMTVDQTNDRETGVGCVFALKDGLYVHNVEFTGFNPGQPGGKINARITTREGVGLVDGFVCTGGGVVNSYPDRAVGIQTGGALEHRGLLTLRNADIRNMGSSAQYFTKSNGAFRLENCYFENNDNTNIRIDGGGHPKKRSWVKDCTVVLDTDNPSVEPDSEYEQTRAFIAESGGGGRHPEEFGGNIGNDGLLVENLDVTVRSVPDDSEYLVGVRRNHGSVTFRNVNVYTEQDGVPPLACEGPLDELEGPVQVQLQEIYVSGPANVMDGISVQGRDQSSIEESQVDLRHSLRSGILLADLKGGVVRNTTLCVPMREQVGRLVNASLFQSTATDTPPPSNYGVLLSNSTAEISGLSFEECQASSQENSTASSNA
jgi:hypothetical protein